MRLRGTVLLAALAAAIPGAAAGQSPSPGETAFRELRKQATGGAPVCTADGGEITYVGPTDEGLVACLATHPGAGVLRVTSLGGPVAPAIAAARELARRGMDVIVAGFCGSSCGNYIVAAAGKLTVLEDSAIMLHGAPLADPQAQREQALAALSRAGLSEDEISDSLLTQATSAIYQQRAIHDRFAREFAVGSEWYDLDGYYAALERLAPPGPMLIVSPAFARACLGHPQIGSYWYPRTAEERDRLQQQIGSPLMFMGADLPEPADCAQ